MSRISARAALEYAISPSVLRLLGVILLGWFLLSIGVGLLVGGPFTFSRGILSVLLLVEWLVGLAVTLAGLLALYGGLVAILYKVITDAVGDADPAG